MPAVFPTPVGVFPSPAHTFASDLGLPHARGGVSFPGAHLCLGLGSSPRPWGCFQHDRSHSQSRSVFPTPVGVFLLWAKVLPARLCLPHARGGVSRLQQGGNNDKQSSPRPWGCFRFTLLPICANGVFPTPVGVFLRGQCPYVQESSLPHARGGVSWPILRGSFILPSSPRPWGCFNSISSRTALSTVFPTPVGVFLNARQDLPRSKGLPHARGGVSARGVRPHEK